MTTTTNNTPASPQPQNSESTLLDTAKTYLPTEDDVQGAMTSVGQAAKTYLPQSVAAYLPSASSSSESPPVPQSSLSTPTRTPLPALPSPAVFDDAPTAPAPTSIDNHQSPFAPAPVLPPFALPSASAVRAGGFALPDTSSPSSAHESTQRPGSADSKFVEGIPSPMPAPAAAEDSSPMVASPTPAPLNTPAVPGSTPINPGLGSANGVSSRAPQVPQGKNAPLPLDAPHFTVVDSGAAASENTDTAPPVPPKTDSAPPAPPTVASPPLPPIPTTTTTDVAHDNDSGAEGDSGSGSGSASDAGADAAAGKKQRRKKPKLLQRLKDKMHVGHAHT
ncbi:hypothetical protein B0H19DRAFT_1123402 [Mycena capillaripes]|nr:hypothetical protein B0H19DRAFT_1123402 [Mycena capillaripes]